MRIKRIKEGRPREPEEEEKEISLKKIIMSKENFLKNIPEELLSYLKTFLTHDERRIL